QTNLLPSIYGVEMCVALMGNILVLWLLVTKERRNWHPGVVFSCNLAISDIFYALSLSLLIVYYSRGRKWGFGNAVCKIERFLFTCNLYVSIYFIMCISVIRYLDIVHPFFTRKHVCPKHAKIISVFVWIFVASLSSPILYYAGVSGEKCSLFANQNNTSNSSLESSQNSKKATYRVFMASIGCLVPFVITFASYFDVLRVVLRNETITSLEKKKVALIVGLACILYAVSFIPYHILQILKFKGEQSKSNCYVRDGYQVSKALACVNMCLHPILYMAVFDKVEQTYRECRIIRQMSILTTSSSLCMLSYSKLYRLESLLPIKHISSFTKELLPPIYGVEMCVALMGNILALYLIVTKERKNWHTGVVFSCNLVISDILYALTLPLLIVYYWKGRIWGFGNAMCKIERFLFTCNLYVSIYFIMCISVNRYLAIVHPFFTRNHIRPKHAKIISLLVWILVAGLSSPIL
ncbi:P2Y purinoceptor 11, partial [Silurus asotus]